MRKTKKGKWALVVDGPGTNNGFVEVENSAKIRWPYAKPDKTSRIITVGTMIY